MTNLQIQILKNLSNISTAYLLTNKDIKVISPSKDILCVVKNLKLSEFKKDVCLLNVPEFLNILSTIGDDYKLDISDNIIQIQNGSTKINYITDNIDYIKDDINGINKFISNIPKDYNFSFEINWNDIVSLMKLIGTLNLDVISFSAKNGIVQISGYSPISSLAIYTNEIKPTNSSKDSKVLKVPTDLEFEEFRINAEMFKKLYTAQISNSKYKFILYDNFCIIEYNLIGKSDLNKVKEIKKKIEDKEDLTEKEEKLLNIVKKYHNTVIKYYIARNI